MRQVTKNPNPPVVKFTQPNHANFDEEKWRVFTNGLIAEFDRDSTPFNTGTRDFNDAYGYDEFRSDLRSTIGSKCCYCEKSLAEGEIEHFRPKKAYRANEGEALTRPGYYWLAYSWENMLLSCDECNDPKRKGNRFPLMTGGVRASSRNMSLDDELPVFINPAKENPSVYIGFRYDQPFGIDANGRGDEVIRLLELKDRGDISGQRHEKFRNYRFSRLLATQLAGNTFFSQGDIDEAIEDCTRLLNPKEPFSGMLVANVNAGTV